VRLSLFPEAAGSRDQTLTRQRSRRFESDRHEQALELFADCDCLQLISPMKAESAA
jgi:hypothetical protein